jgi:hypothetical protein
MRRRFKLIKQSEGSSDVSSTTILTEDDESATLPNSRRLVAGSNITFNDAVPNVRTISATVPTATPSPRGATWVRSGLAIAVPVNKVSIYFPTAATINGVVVLTQGGTGSCVVNIKKAAYASYPPTSSICASAKPTISSAIKYLDTTLTGWTTAISAGDVLLFELESSSTFTVVHCYLTFA